MLRMLTQLGALGIRTGWLAFVLFLPLAATSNDASVQRLGRNGKALHRIVQVAAILTLAHGMFVQDNRMAAVLHFVPLALLELYRLAKWGRGWRRPAEAA